MSSPQTKAIITAVGKQVKKWIKEDRNHKIRILEDYVAGTFAETVLGKRVPDYDCRYFSIRDRVLTVKKTEGEPVVDGADLAPDKIGGLDFAAGYIPHDLGYEEIDNMAADPAWIEAGWDAGSIRQLWDIVLGRGVRSSGRGKGSFWGGVAAVCASVYYGAVRLLGGLYRKYKDAINGALKLLLAAAIALGLSGCGGCMVPDGFEPAGEPVPYEVVAE